MSQRKRHWFFSVCLIIISGLVVYFGTSHDAMLYHQQIGEVIGIKEQSPITTVDEFKNKDQTTAQILTMRLLNGPHQGQVYQVKNTYSRSGGITHHYRLYQSAFLTRHYTKGQVIYQISHFKRDTTLLMMCWLLLVVLIVMMNWQSLRTLLSVVINFILFIIFVQVDVIWNLTNFFWLFAFSALLFTAISLSIVIGLNKQFVVSFLAIVLATSMALGLGSLVLKLFGSGNVHYEALNYATQSPTQLFFSATVIGLLGAVMDAAIDIVSTLFALAQAGENISPRQIFQSGMKVGQAIMGPLTNVLLLIFFSETVTMAILFFRTGNTFAYTFSWTMSLGIIQTLISGIGITLVVPIASLLSSYYLKAGHPNGN